MLKYSLAKNLKSVSEKKMTKLFQSLQRTYILFYHATQKFISDAATIRGNAIAYAIIISIIPITTIFIQMAKVNRSVIKAHIAGFLATYGLSDTSELMGILDEIMARAETIAGIGFLFVLYSASNFFRHLENAFCHIYRCYHPRPLLYRFALYISAFILLPIIIIFTSQFIQNIYYKFQAPDLQSVILRLNLTNDSQNSVKNTGAANMNKWVSTSDGKLYVYDFKNEKKQVIHLATKITQSAPYREYFIDLKNKKQGFSWEVLETPSYTYQIDQHKRFNIIRCLQTKDTIYAISSVGSVYYSQDEGQTWQYQQLLLNNNNDIYAPQVRDAYGNAQGHIYFLIDEISSSILITRLTKENWRYRKFNSRYHRIFSINNIQQESVTNTENLAKRTLPIRNGLYLAGKSQLIYSNNEGRNWQGPYEEVFGERKVLINAIQADQQGNLYLAGNNGTFWIRKNNGEKLYPDIQSKSYQNINHIYMQENGKGLLLGSGNLWRYTQDKGKTWHLPANNHYNNINFLAYAVYKNNLNEQEFYFAGNKNTLLKISKLELPNKLNSAPELKKIKKDKTPAANKAYDVNGKALVKWQSQELLADQFWESFIVNALIKPLLVFVIFAIFFLLYVLVPYAKVSWRAAAIGAAFSAISTSLFLFFFRTWLSSSSTTTYIYGAWAAIPLGMLIVLVSTYILLFGLELAYVIQHSFLYNWDDESNNKKNCTFWNCLYLLCLCYNSLQKNKRPLTKPMAEQNFKSNGSNLEISRALLIDCDLLYYDENREEYLPLEAAKSLTLNDLRQRLAHRILRIPKRLLNAQLQEEMNEFTQNLVFQESKATSSTQTVNDILPAFFAQQEKAS